MECKRCGAILILPHINSFCLKCADGYNLETKQLSNFYFVNKKMIAGVSNLLQGLKEVYPDLNLESEHLKQTPTRVARMFIELCRGLSQDPTAHLTTAFEESDYEGIVLVDNIHFQSLCCHHFAIFRGVAHVGYIPDGRVVGLSKINRVVEALACRPQIQEQLTYQIAHTINDTLNPRGVAVVIEGSHDCIEVRGIKSKGSTTKTSEMLGVFLQNKNGCKDELLKMIYDAR